jgi:hypothetical protein
MFDVLMRIEHCTQKLISVIPLSAQHLAFKEASLLA